MASSDGHPDDWEDVDDWQDASPAHEYKPPKLNVYHETETGSPLDPSVAGRAALMAHGAVMGLDRPIYAAGRALLEGGDKPLGQRFNEAEEDYGRGLQMLTEDAGIKYPLAYELAGGAVTSIPAALETGAVKAAPALLRVTKGIGTGGTIAGIQGAAGGHGSLGSHLQSGLEAAPFGMVLGGGAEAASGPLARLAARLGTSVEDLAGRLKVSSLRPVPKLAEAMEELPGGRAGVGKLLLQKGIGKLTKSGTASQLEGELNKSGASISDIAAAHDAAGGEPIDVGDAIENGMNKARKLQEFRQTRPAGDELMSQANEIAEDLGHRSEGEARLPATEALELKRNLGKSAYSKSNEGTLTGSQVSGELGAGLAGLERGVDFSMDKALGPEFEAKNLEYRRLLGASNAADRTAARESTNHLVGLKDLAAASAGGLPAAIAHSVISRYGSQAAARGLYSASRGAISTIPSAVRSIASNPQAMGRFAPALQSALGKGDNSFMALHHSLMEREPEYKANAAKLQEQETP